MRPSARGRPQTSGGAGSPAGRRARSWSLDHFEVHVLECRGHHSYAEDFVAGRDELSHDARHVLTVRVWKAPRAVCGLDLDAPGTAKLVRRTRGDDPPVVDDHDTVADALDLGEQVRVEQ